MKPATKWKTKPGAKPGGEVRDDGAKAGDGKRRRPTAANEETGRRRQTKSQKPTTANEEADDGKRRDRPTTADERRQTRRARQR